MGVVNGDVQPTQVVLSFEQDEAGQLVKSGTNFDLRVNIDTGERWELIGDYVGEDYERRILGQ